MGRLEWVPSHPHVPGPTPPEQQLETEVAGWVGQQSCLGCTSLGAGQGESAVVSTVYFTCVCGCVCAFGTPSPCHPGQAPTSPTPKADSDVLTWATEIDPGEQMCNPHWDQ